MGVDPHSVKAEALDLEDLVALLRSETAALHQGRDLPVAFLCSMGGTLAGYCLSELPRHDTTENQRVLLHQVVGLLNALADTY